MSTTIQEDIFTEVIARLRAATGLSYVKEVYEGDRIVNSLLMPAIMVDVDSNEEIEDEFPRSNRTNMYLMIRGCIDVSGDRITKQIVGDSTQVGILRMENDIKKAFEGSDLSVNGNIFGYKFSTIQYRLIENAVKEVTIRLELNCKYLPVANRI